MTLILLFNFLELNRLKKQRHFLSLCIQTIVKRFFDEKKILKENNCLVYALFSIRCTFYLPVVLNIILCLERNL